MTAEHPEVRRAMIRFHLVMARADHGLPLRAAGDRSHRA